MDWENERYVRVYCRDTGDLLVVGWIGRAVMWELMRKCDRAGIIDTIERPVLAELIRLPIDELNTGLDALLARRCVVEARLDGKEVLFIPNHMRAQEASSSDAQRQRESRARRHDKAKLDLVTICDEPSGGRDQQRDNGPAPSSQNVTNPPGAGHAPPVGGHSVPSLADPSPAEPSPWFNSDDLAGIFSELRVERGGGKYRPQHTDYKRLNDGADWAREEAPDGPSAAARQSIENYLDGADAGLRAKGLPLWGWSNDPGAWLAWKPTGTHIPLSAAERPDEDDDLEKMKEATREKTR